ncbi:MAG: hypothetical protein GY835_18315, partial [bacterium]|nr:hypothetical protein [bacterium]
MNEVNDLSRTIEPKSDQLNSDDLFTGPRTIAITCVSAQASSVEQPVAINFEGDGGKPWKPCKSMRRVLVHAWGSDGNKYSGRRLTLYRDPNVMFGGIQVGGIRISHLSHIDADVTMPLTVSRAQRTPFTVKPLRDAGHGQLNVDPEHEKAVKARAIEVAAMGRGALRDHYQSLNATDKEIFKHHQEELLRCADEKSASVEGPALRTGAADDPADTKEDQPLAYTDADGEVHSFGMLKEFHEAYIACLENINDGEVLESVWEGNLEQLNQLRTMGESGVEVADEITGTFMQCRQKFA